MSSALRLGDAPCTQAAKLGCQLPDQGQTTPAFSLANLLSTPVLWYRLDPAVLAADTYYMVSAKNDGDARYHEPPFRIRHCVYLI